MSIGKNLSKEDEHANGSTTNGQVAENEIMDQGQEIYNVTPLRLARVSSLRLGCHVWLKLENLQPSQSFKARGISRFVQDQINRKGKEDIHFVIASAGNAGFALSYAAWKLGVPSTVVVPEASSEEAKDFLRAHGSEVIAEGENYPASCKVAKKLMEEIPHAISVHAHDHPVIWEGHSTMVDEIFDQLESNGRKVPRTIFCTVGGAGLLAGILIGLKRRKAFDVHVVTLEPFGSNSFHLSMNLNRGLALPNNIRDVEFISDEEIGLVRLNTFTSRATSLAVRSPITEVVRMALQWQGGVTCVSIEDEAAMETSLGLANEHKFLIELACSTALTPAYFPTLLDRLVPDRKEEDDLVFITCGGRLVSLDNLVEYSGIVKQRTQPTKAFVQGEWLDMEETARNSSVTY